MMIQKKHIGLIILILSFLLFFTTDVSQLKVLVTVDDSSIKATPDIRGETLVKVAINTVLIAEEVQGEWYKVTMQNEETEISGYIHEMLVKVTSEEEIAALEEDSSIVVRKTEEEIIAEIEAGIESNKARVREKTQMKKAEESLRSLIALVFRITDTAKQRELAAEIYLWIGMAYAELGKDYPALKEMRNMFEVEHAYALEMTRNIVDTRVISLINQAEKEYTGELTEYSVQVVSQPGDADIFINGSKIGSSPVAYSSKIPQLDIEVKKDGYKILSERIFLTKENSRKEYSLERLGRNIAVISTPEKANVYFDGTNTGKITNCILEYIAFGEHEIRIKKENYSEWKATLNVDAGNKLLEVDAVLIPDTYEFERQWDSRTGLLENPTGIALDADGNFYVIDENRSNVKKFSAEGQLQRSWKVGGNGYPGLKKPGGIAIDNDGYIYVSDTQRNCVMKFNKQGRFLLKWGKEGRDADEFIIPRGIAVNDNSDIYVADSGNNRIKIYAHTGALKKSYGKPGLKDGDFASPVALAFNKNNELLVLDRMRIQKFSSDMEFISSWGTAKIKALKLKSPRGIVIDQQNCVYLADSGNNRVLKFDDKGVLVTELGGSEDSKVKFIFPIGLAVDKKGRIFVVERDSSKIQLFAVPSNNN